MSIVPCDTLPMFSWLSLCVTCAAVNDESVPSLLRRLDTRLSAEVTLAKQLALLDALRDLESVEGRQLLSPEYQHILDNQRQLTTSNNSQPGYLNRLIGWTTITLCTRIVVARCPWSKTLSKFEIIVRPCHITLFELYRSSASFVDCQIVKFSFNNWHLNLTIIKNVK